MTEPDAIDRSDRPVTLASAAEELERGGLQRGSIVLVHSSLSALGWVCGGTVAVIGALQQVVTSAGTIVVPTFCADNSDPSQWEAPPVPEAWWQTIRDHTPPFDPATTPTRGMGRLPEAFRGWPDVHRSDHPACSFAAWGAHAREITRDHALDYPFGESSPLARLYDLDGSVLLLGVTHANNTSLHLSEARARGTDVETLHAAASINGERVWTEYLDHALDATVFPEIGRAFEAGHDVNVFTVGVGESRLMRQRPLVDFGVRWLERSRE